VWVTRRDRQKRKGEKKRLKTLKNVEKRDLNKNVINVYCI